ncbi:MAG: hypothetical protein HKM23_07750 [Nitrosopumilus sp.]|nr:hypothetical protein [Nitrosopumilus sp.]
MPQNNGHYHIIGNHRHLMQIIQYKFDKPNQSLIESEAKNPLSSTATDMIGLSWIFKDQDLLEEFK